MSKRQDPDLLCDIKEAIRRINSYLEDLNYEKNFEDAKTQDAVVRNLERK